MRTLGLLRMALLNNWRKVDSGSARLTYPRASEQRWIFVTVFVLALVWNSFAFAQPFPIFGSDSHLLYVSLPPDVSKEELVRPSESVRVRLHRVAAEQLASQIRLQPQPGDADDKLSDRIVVFIDHTGQPILPDLDASKSRRNDPKKSSSPSLTAANELTFTFNSSSSPWTPAELTTLNTVLNDCYPIAKTVYGNPAFNITVNVRKDATISFAGLYFPSINEMVLRGTSTADPICHEMIHAFRDDIFISLSSFEEGMTRAAEVEVFNRLPSYLYFDRNHSYTYDVYYEALNRQEIGSQHGSFHNTNPNTFLLLRYQLAGYAWAKAWLENASFFVDFNAQLYARTLSDPTTNSSESKLLDIAVTVQSAVEGKSFLAWYSQQGVFNTDPPNGYFLYQRINQFTVDHFFRDASGFETMQPSVTIQWTVYDHQGGVMDSGSGVTSAFGWISFNPILTPGYTGRIKVVTTASTPNGPISNISLSFAGNASGVFGIVPNATSGTILITPLDDPAPPVSLNIINGGFFAPSLATLKGRFRAQYQDTHGQTVVKQFTKDASDYFLFMASGPTISVIPMSQGFGNVIVGSSADRNFTVQNIGEGTLTGSGSTSAPYIIMSGGSYNLTAGQSQIVGVRFSPTSAGLFGGTVTFTGGGGANRTVTGTGVAAATLTIAATDSTATESGPTTGTFRVSRTGSTVSSLTVFYTLGGTAVSGTDYTLTPAPSSVTIPAGSSSATITVTPINDVVMEGNETAVMTLSPRPNYTVGSPSSATVTIVSDERVTITATDSTATEAGPTHGDFTVSRTGSTASSLTVFYTLGGTAVSGTDYTLTPAPSSVTIPAGASSKTITVTPINDVVMEGNETVVATLSPRPNYTVGAPSSSTVTFVSDERVTITSTDSTATESGSTTGTFRVSRTGSAALIVDGFLIL